MSWMRVKSPVSNLIFAISQVIQMLSEKKTPETQMFFVIIEAFELNTIVQIRVPGQGFAQTSLNSKRSMINTWCWAISEILIDFENHAKHLEVGHDSAGSTIVSHPQKRQSKLLTSKPVQILVRLKLWQQNHVSFNTHAINKYRRISSHCTMGS